MLGFPAPNKEKPRKQRCARTPAKKKQSMGTLAGPAGGGGACSSVFNIKWSLFLMLLLFCLQQWPLLQKALFLEVHFSVSSSSIQSSSLSTNEVILDTPDVVKNFISVNREIVKNTTITTKCGQRRKNRRERKYYAKDCKRHYQLHDILLNSLLSRHTRVQHYSRQLQHEQQQERDQQQRDCTNNTIHPFCLSWKQHNDGIRFGRDDKGLVRALHKFILDEKVTSLHDFGARTGLYSKSILEQHAGSDPPIVVTNYDILVPTQQHHPNVVVEFADLTLPMAIPRAEWILSLDVGPFIPSPSEGMYIRNLHVHNCRGIILGWPNFDQHEDARKQGVDADHEQKLWNGAINLHNNKYIISILEALGYHHDRRLEQEFRKATERKSLANSLLVFRRPKPVC